MTPSRQRNLIFALLAIGLVVLTITIGIALTRPQRDIPREDAADKTPASEGFTFFDLNRTTVLTRSLRATLSQTLGADAIAHKNPIDLTVVDREFFRTQLPELHELNQVLNPPLRARREHDTTRLTYHRAQLRQMPFRYVELVFSKHSGLPLYFVINPSEDFETGIATLKSKYGQPQSITIDPQTPPVLIWEKAGDILVATTFPRRSGRTSQELRIYFIDNLKGFVEREAQARREQNQGTREAGKRAF
jgi:hypothetical protein